LFFHSKFEDFAFWRRAGRISGLAALAEAVEFEKNQIPHRKELWLYRRIQGYTTEVKSVNNILRRLTLYYPAKYGAFRDIGR